MKLFFIRHGQSENNALWDRTGAEKGRVEDPELTEIGHEQAHLLAEFISQKDAEARADGRYGEPKRDFFGLTHLYTSLMVRSVATATHLAQSTGLPLVGWPEIHECGGIYLEDGANGMLTGLPGKSRSYFTENYQHLILPETVTDEGWWNRPFEKDEDYALRAQRVMETLIDRHGGTDDRVAIVSHGAFYNALARVLLGINQIEGWLLMYNTAISRFDFDKRGRVRLMYHNRTDHLPERLLT